MKITDKKVVKKGKKGMKNITPEVGDKIQVRLNANPWLKVSAIVIEVGKDTIKVTDPLLMAMKNSVTIASDEIRSIKIIRVANKAIPRESNIKTMRKGQPVSAIQGGKVIEGIVQAACSRALFVQFGDTLRCDKATSFTII